MRLVGVVLILLVLSFFGGKRYYKVSNFAYLSDQSVHEDYERLNKELKGYDAKLTVPIGGADRLEEMRKERVGLWLEGKRRSWELDGWMPILGFLGLAFLFLPSLWGKWKKAKQSKKKERRRKVEDEIREAASREEYVDEWDFHRKIEGGFQSREEAVAWLLHDPLLNCDYCGGRLKSTYEAGREALQMVTFYKKVPEGARDLRIVLGSYWFALTASEIKCSSCGRVVRR